MNQLVKLKCPNCGAILSVNAADIANIDPTKATVTCKVCNKKNFLANYQTQAEKTQADGETQIAGQTQYSQESNQHPGSLVLQSTGQRFILKEGRQVIGRRVKSGQSDADIAIDCPDNRMSRCHLVVEVRQVKGEGMVHYLSLYKEHVNPTFVGKQPLEYGDCLVLQPGMVIHLPSVDLCFELQDDEEGTQYDESR